MARQVFVGRERELAELADLLDQAKAGHGGLALVTGEPGAGKTALVEQLCARAGDALVRWASCWDGQGQPPYWAWVQVLRQELATGARPAGRDAAHLVRLAPELADSPAAEGSRFEVYDALARFLGDLSRATPRLVVVDDLQWADEASVGFLEFLAGHLPRLALLVVATARDTDLGPQAPLLGALPDLSRAAVRVALGGLGLDEVADLLEGVTGHPPDAGLAAQVVLESGGNALFATEMGRLLATRADGSLPVPPAVVDVIEQRLARLPPAGVNILRTAAVLGLHFDIAELAEAHGTDHPTALDALGPAIEARIVRVDDGPSSRLTFTHALVRRALTDRLSALDLARRHAEVSEMLERRPGLGAEHVARLADHLVAALPLVDRSRVAAAAQAAGDAAVATLAFADATRRYEQALDLVSGADAEAGTRLELLLLLGDAQWRAGAGATSQATFFAAVDLARRLHEADAFAAAALGAAKHAARYERRPDIVGLLEEALHLLPSGDSSRRVEVLAGLGERLPPWTDRTDECTAVARQAIAMARRLDDPAPVALALRAAHEALHSCDTVAERRGMAEEQLAMARGRSDPELAAEASRELFTVALESSDRPALDRALTGLSTAAATLRRPSWRYEHLKASVAVALLEGRLQDALADHRRIAELAQWAEVAEAQSVLALELVVAGLDFELLGYGQTVDAFVALYRRAPVLRAPAGGGSALALVLLGREDEAQPIVDDVLAAVDDQLLRRYAILAGGILVARAAARMGATRGLDRVYRFLLPYEDQVGIIARGAVGVGPVAQGLGVAAAALGDVAAAERHFARAEELAVAMRAPAWRARNAAELARALVGAGEHGRAVGAIATARRLGQALGMTRLVSELDALDSAPAPRAPSRLAATRSSLVRDGDVWTVEHGGVRARLRDSKGLRYVADLVSHPGVERHALDLVALVEGHPTEAGLQRRQLGDAGPMLDERSKAAYRRRLLDLREELDEAEAFNDLERAARARAEIDALADELSRAVGLGGRDRRAASAAERARLNVTRAVRAAVARIEEAVPGLGAHLDRRVRTGIFCAYEPTPEDSVPWGLTQVFTPG